jgi:class 3 adenylate cyclase
MSSDPATRQGAARAAIEHSAWTDAFDQFSALDATAPLEAADLARLAEAAWWTGRLTVCIMARERAYASYARDGNVVDAARMAIDLCRDHFAKGDADIGGAWLNRADRLLQGAPEDVAHGYLARMRGVMAFEGSRDFDAALELVRRAYEIGTRHKERNLMALGLHDQGRILIAAGRVREGTQLVDEVTVAAISGELDSMATAIIYCNTIVAYKDLGDYPRARDWTEAAKRWCERQAIAGFPGMCRVYRAGIMRMRGDLVDADGEARRACEELREFNRGYCSSAFYELGEVRLRLGDLAGAEAAFQSAHELGHDPQPGLSLLHLAQGHTKAAVAGIKRASETGPRDALGRTRLLPAMVEIFVHADAVDAATAAAAELAAAAETFGTVALRASVGAAQGAVHLARADYAAAAPSLRDAVTLWQSIDCPYEAARARMDLATAYAALGDDDGMKLELTSARTTFERLGALLDARRASQRLAAANGDDAPATSHRMTQTFMFTDIVRSTALIDAIGDAAWTDLTRWHDQTLRALFARHRGEEIDHAGDGFFIAFEEAAAGIACAIAIQQDLAAHRRAHGFAPAVRIGLHTTAAERVDASFRGRGVHEAARIGAEANGDEIIASRAVVDAVPSGVPTTNPRRVTLRGLPTPVDLLTVDWRAS